MRTVRVSLRPLQLLSNRQNLPKEFKNLKTAGNPWENDFLSRLTLPLNEFKPEGRCWQLAASELHTGSACDAGSHD